MGLHFFTAKDEARLAQIARVRDTIVENRPEEGVRRPALHRFGSLLLVSIQHQTHEGATDTRRAFMQDDQPWHSFHGWVEAWLSLPAGEAVALKLHYFDRHGHRGEISSEKEYKRWLEEQWVICPMEIYAGMDRSDQADVRSILCEDGVASPRMSQAVVAQLIHNLHELGLARDDVNAFLAFIQERLRLGDWASDGGQEELAGSFTSALELVRRSAKAFDTWQVRLANCAQSVGLLCLVAPCY